MWLLIDDCRGGMGCDVIARDAEAGKMLLQSHKWECLCIDHDLGAGENGYEVLMWAVKTGCLPDRVQVVTSNPPARVRMAAVLEKAGYNNARNFDFTKKKVDGTDQTPTVASNT